MFQLQNLLLSGHGLFGKFGRHYSCVRLPCSRNPFSRISPLTFSPSHRITPLTGRRGYAHQPPESADGVSGPKSGSGPILPHSVGAFQSIIIHTNQIEDTGNGQKFTRALLGESCQCPSIAPCPKCPTHAIFKLTGVSLLSSFLCNPGVNLSLVFSHLLY